MVQAAITATAADAPSASASAAASWLAPANTIVDSPMETPPPSPVATGVAPATRPNGITPIEHRGDRPGPGRQLGAGGRGGHRCMMPWHPPPATRLPRVDGRTLCAGCRAAAPAEAPAARLDAPRVLLPRDPRRGHGGGAGPVASWAGRRAGVRRRARRPVRGERRLPPLRLVRRPPPLDAEARPRDDLPDDRRQLHAGVPDGPRGLGHLDDARRSRGPARRWASCSRSPAGKASRHRAQHALHRARVGGRRRRPADVAATCRSPSSC